MKLSSKAFVVQAGRTITESNRGCLTHPGQRQLGGPFLLVAWSKNLGRRSYYDMGQFHILSNYLRGTIDPKA